MFLATCIDLDDAQSQLLAHPVFAEINAPIVLDQPSPSTHYISRDSPDAPAIIVAPDNMSHACVAALFQSTDDPDYDPADDAALLILR